MGYCGASNIDDWSVLKNAALICPTDEFSFYTRIRY
jgi:hypothetical protein